jgi:hypothetical protein
MVDLEMAVLQGMEVLEVEEELHLVQEPLVKVLMVRQVEVGQVEEVLVNKVVHQVILMVEMV